MTIPLRAAPSKMAGRDGETARLCRTKKLLVDHISGLSGLGPGDNAVEVLADHPGDLLHWRDARTHDIGAPLPEHGGDDIDLLAVEDGAQMFAIDPGAGGAFAGGLGDQGVKVGPVGGGQAVAVLKQRPAQSLKTGIGALFETPGLVEAIC